MDNSKRFGVFERGKSVKVISAMETIRCVVVLLFFSPFKIRSIYMHSLSGVLKALREQGIHQEFCVPLVTWYIEIPVYNVQVFFFSCTIENTANKN